ncbi:transglutaminase family protein [Rhodocytophaga rosea]|uniref:Transglutaminase family protein n=1 Tax=Rhodocytophaga rosea TaxID=2704465 RepID=A0A6C0GNF2_9BACT|nr:transglutaminase family protein [Rhodocytophaga rosea]QHT69374.1 transglutaminase family protein [Rhodocytophaga rosea]
MTTEYQIEYYTHNVYETQVTDAYFEFLVAPCKDATQEITKLHFTNTLGEELYFHSNPFGLQVACLRTIKPFTDFAFCMKATVEKVHHNPYNISQLSLKEEQSSLLSRDFYIDHHLYLEYSKYTTISDVYSDLILYRKTDQSIFDFLQQLNQYIYDMLEFDTDPTDVHTTPDEVIFLKKGVCQDYSHLFLAMARKNRIPCRYVSGYLNQGNTNFVGAAVMHAWAEAFIPGHGWHGFDPTNNLLADLNHIKAAHGADYSDCSPLKGVLKTIGSHTMDYQVKVIPHVMENAQQ